MTGLQEAFYIIGIIYMSISLLIILGILVGLGIIRKKIVSLERMIKDRLELVTAVGQTASEVINTVKKITKRK